MSEYWFAFAASFSLTTASPIMGLAFPLLFTSAASCISCIVLVQNLENASIIPSSDEAR